MTETAAERTEFPMHRSCPFHPPEQYAELRNTRPIQVTLASGRRAWLIAKHEDVRRILTDPRLSSDRKHPGFPLQVALPDDAVRQMSASLIGQDPPGHTALRRLVINEFTVKRMRTLRPRIQEIVDDCLDDMLAAGPPVDLVRSLSLPVPSLVICELLGVPYADHDFFQQHTAVMVHRKSTPQQRSAAVNELAAYLDDLVTEKENNPADDILSRLVLKQPDPDTLDHQGLVALARLLLIAGHETTANMISLGTVALLENPDQLAALRADPSLMPKAVEELLRYFSIADQATVRVALDDIEIGGVSIREGEGVIALGAAANRDERAFDDPDELDIHRDARHHVAFGYGVHQCLGQNLARLELEIVFETLFRRIPDLRVATPVAELPFKDDAIVYGIVEMPVSW